MSQSGWTPQQPQGPGGSPPQQPAAWPGNGGSAWGTAWGQPYQDQGYRGQAHQGQAHQGQARPVPPQHSGPAQQSAPPQHAQAWGSQQTPSWAASTPAGLPAGARPYQFGTVSGPSDLGAGYRPPGKRSGGVLAGCMVAAGVMALLLSMCGVGTVLLSRTSSSEATWTRATTSPQGPSRTQTTSTRPASPTSTRTTSTSIGTTPPPTHTSPPKPPPPAQVPPVPPGPTWQALPKPHSNHPGWVATQQNRLNGYPIPAVSCVAIPNKITSIAQYQTLVKALAECEFRRWQPTFTAMGKPLGRPKVVFHNGTVQSACGSVTNTKATFYCAGGNGTAPAMFMHYNLMEESNTWWRLRVAETTAHEFMHHVQSMSGVRAGRYQLVQAGLDRYDLTRRSELQVSCVVSRMLLTTKGWAFSRQDYDVTDQWWKQDQDREHGNAASNNYWGKRGYYQTKVGGCNTWLVASAWVA